MPNYISEDSMVYIIKEHWTNKDKTLEQYISYANNKRDQIMARDMLDPRLDILVRTIYLDKNMEELEYYNN